MPNLGVKIEDFLCHMTLKFAGRQALCIILSPYVKLELGSRNG